MSNFLYRLARIAQRELAEFAIGRRLAQEIMLDGLRFSFRPLVCLVSHLNSFSSLGGGGYSMGFPGTRATEAQQRPPPSAAAVLTMTNAVLRCAVLRRAVTGGKTGASPEKTNAMYGSTKAPLGVGMSGGSESIDTWRTANPQVIPIGCPESPELRHTCTSPAERSGTSEPALTFLPTTESREKPLRLTQVRPAD